MKTFTEASDMFTALTSTEAEHAAHNLMSRYEEIIKEIGNSPLAQRDMNLLIEAMLIDVEPNDFPDYVRSIALSAFIRGVIIGIEMEKD